MRRRKRRIFMEAEMPLAAMIDIVFLLLIYFIFTQKPIVENTLFGVTFPTQNGKSSSRNIPSTILCVEIRNGTVVEGNFLLNGQPYDFSKLKEILRETVSHDPQTLIMVKCDLKSKHSDLISFLDFCHSARINKISLSG